MLQSKREMFFFLEKEKLLSKRDGFVLEKNKLLSLLETVPFLKV